MWKALSYGKTVVCTVLKDLLVQAPIYCRQSGGVQGVGGCGAVFLAGPFRETYVQF